MSEATNEGEYASVHMRVPIAIAREMDAIVQHIKKDPELRRLTGKIGRPQAIFYAIGQVAKQLPRAGK